MFQQIGKCRYIRAVRVLNRGLIWVSKLSSHAMGCLRQPGSFLSPQVPPSLGQVQKNWQFYREFDGPLWHPRSSHILGVQGLPWHGLEMICLTGLCHAEEETCETLHRLARRSLALSSVFWVIDSRDTETHVKNHPKPMIMRIMCIYIYTKFIQTHFPGQKR